MTIIMGNQNYQYNQQQQKLKTENYKMKHIDIQAIMQKRKNSKVKDEIFLQTISSTKPTKQVKFKEINDVGIDNIIKKCMDRKYTLNTQNKLDILQIIYQKTGVQLNKKVVADKMSTQYYQYVKEIDSAFHKSHRSYFILKGQAMVYQEKELFKSGVKFNTQPVINALINLDDLEGIKYINLENFMKTNEDFKMIQQSKEYRGFGPLFQVAKTPSSLINNEKKKKFVAIDAVIVCFEEFNLQFESLFNDGLGTQQKMQLLNHFPILKLMGKKLHSFINNFKVKRYTLKDYIYKQGQRPQAVYFIIKGQVGFQLVLEQEGEKVHTDVMGDRNHFGEEEIILKSARVQTAQVTSSKCMKFEKCMENSELSDAINKCLRARLLKRQQKLAKLRTIIQIQSQKRENKISQRLTQQQVKKLIIHDKPESKRKFSMRRKNHAKTKIMHGNLVREYQDDNEAINFSMLKVNPDMYEAVKKNYRIYDVKPLEYDKPTVKDFKKIWNILNLQDILREEEINISGPEGRKYYDTHRRLMAHVQQSKSLRPKTSSSTYRTKLQYIAYLQQFNNN